MWNIIGHEKQVKFLQKSIQKGRLSHAYLFIGPEGVGKMAVATAFAKALQCQKSSDGEFCGQCRSCSDIEKNNHPDVHLVSAQSKSDEISIAQIRKLRKDFSLSPLSGKYKIGIIKGADRLGVPGANAFLKTLEEPWGKAVFILTSSRKRILPTISSRCQILKFPSLSTANVFDALTTFTYSNNNNLRAKSEATSREVRSRLQKIARVSMGRPGIALNMIKNPEIIKKQEDLIKDLISLLKANYGYRFKYAERLSKDRDEIKKVLSCWICFLRDELLSSYNCKDLTIWKKSAPQSGKTLNIIKNLKKTYNIITSTNVNPRLALEVLMFNL